MADFTTNVSPYGYPTTVGSAKFDKSFESGTTDGISTSNLCTYAATNDPGNGYGGGNYYLTVTSTDAATTKYIKSDAISLTGGSPYQVRLYIKNGSIASQLVRISCYAGGTEYFSAVHTTTNTWQELTHAFTAYGSGAVDHWIWIYWYDDAASSETLLLDAITLYEVKGETERIIPFEQTKDGYQYLIAAGRNYGSTGWLYADFEDGTFPPGALYQNVTASEKVSYAKVRDTLIVADGGDIWGWAGTNVYPAAMLNRKTATEYTDVYDWIYDQSPHDMALTDVLFVGYTRPFIAATLDGIHRITFTDSSLSYYGGKFYYWKSFNNTSEDLLNDNGLDGACGDANWNCSPAGGTETWVISGSSASIGGTQGASRMIWQGDLSAHVKPGYTYETVFTVSNYSAGNVRLGVGSAGLGTWRSANGTYTEVITASSTEPGLYFYITADSTFAGTVDTVGLLCLTVKDPNIETDQEIITGNLWDGFDWMYAQDAIFQISGTTDEYRDYSYWVRNSSTETYMDISEMESGGTIYLSFPYPPWAVKIWLPELNKNTAAATLTAKYWDGDSWESLSITDGTSDGSATMAQTGLITYTMPTNWEARTYGQSTFSGYPVILKTSATLDNYVRIFKVTAIPYPESINTEDWKMVGAYRNRLVLANGYDLSILRVSEENQPDTFVGPDSCYIQVGKKEKFTGLADLREGLLVMKKTDNFFITGVNPATFHVEPFKGTAPNVAPYSLVTIDRDAGVFAIYQGPDGIYAIFPDGKNPKLSEDIKAYWETGNALAIPAAWLDNTQGWYDKLNQEYHALIGSGSGVTQYNVELVYSLPMSKWTTFTRNNAIELSTAVAYTDSDNDFVMLGASYNGVIYTLENGTTDDSYSIAGKVKRKPVVLSGGIGKREMVGTALYYDLLSGTTLAATLDVTNGIASGSTTTQSSYTLTDEGFYFDFLRGPLYKGHYFVQEWNFTDPIYLHNQVIWSRDAEWPKR
jgi:hypothetical protein